MYNSQKAKKKCQLFVNWFQSFGKKYGSRLKSNFDQLKSELEAQPKLQSWKLANTYLQITFHSTQSGEVK